MSRVLCLPHAGGAATAYQELSAALPPEISAATAQYPGRQDRRLEPCPATVDGYVGPIVASLAEMQDLPISIFGHSFGATLAYEVARACQARSIPVSRLIVSGRRAPADQVEIGLSGRSDRAIIQELRFLRATDDRLLDDEDVQKLILPALRGDYSAIERYTFKPGEMLSCPITALVGDHDPKATPAEAAKWAEYTEGEFQLEVFPGGHFYLHQEVGALSRLLTRLLLGDSSDRAGGGSAAAAPN
ncbi:thioesterase II family protein [Streptomyces sp. NPDC058045]|uniref:thioesterase II family protein n=1 Tax=Streptomyces sp. NPDC058045 TaxID=3346311 RepID=UPI0036E9807E